MDYSIYPKFIAFCTAQRKFEGGGGGYFNPANLRCPDDNKLAWNRLAIGSRNNFCNFPTVAVGVEAHENEIYSICTSRSATYNVQGKKLYGVLNSGDLTIGQMISIYAPVGDNNEPVHYAQTVCQWAGLQTTDTMKSLIINDIPSPIVSPIQPVVEKAYPPTFAEDLGVPPMYPTVSFWSRIANFIFRLFT